MLVSKDAVMDMLRCPKSGAQLKRNGASMIAENEAKTSYAIAEGYPVLVDYDDSIFSETQGVSSAVGRPSYRGWKRVLKKLASPDKRSTANNVAEFITLVRALSDQPRVLIVAGGSIGQGMQSLYDDHRIQLVGFDVYGSEQVQFIADAHKIPLPDDYFDGVILQAVLEHVLEPQQVVSEVSRVLKKEGIVYAETPFLQHVHEGPYDFMRFTESGHRYLFKDYRLLKSGASAGAGTQALWSIDFLFRGLFRSRTAGQLAKLLFFWLRYLDRYIPESYSVDAASGVFFLGEKSERPISKRSIVDHYKGAQTTG